MLVIRSGTLPVGTTRLRTLSLFSIFRISGHDLGIGNESRNQSRTDGGKTLPEDSGTPLPQKKQGQREPPREPKHAGGSNLPLKGAFREHTRSQHDAALVTLSVNNIFA